MPTPTLDEILEQPTVDEAMDGIVLPELRAERDGVALPVSDWFPGGVYRTLSFGAAALFTEVKRLIGTFAAATFGEYAFGFSTPPSGMDVTGWATDRARDRGVERILASHTKRTLVFTNATASSYGPIAAGTMVVLFPLTGNRYVNDAEFTIDPSTDTSAVFRSEYAVDSSAGLNYLDGSGATIRITTARYSGVTVTNPAATFTTTTQTGSGTGTVTLSGTPAGGFTIAAFSVRIDTGGAAGVASWSYRIQRSAGDTGWVSAGAVTSVANASSSGVTITLADGAGTPSFVARNVYRSATPGTDVTVRGRDLETPQELGRRWRAVMPLLQWSTDPAGNFVPPAAPVLSAFEAMTLKAFPEQVKVCYARTSPTVNDKILIFVAGQGATLDAGTVAAVQEFWDLNAGIGNLPVVDSPATVAINLTLGTVTVRRAQLATAQAAIQNAFAAYLSGVDPRLVLPMIGDGSTVYVQREYLIALVMNTPGVIGFTDDIFAINGVADDYLLAADTMATWNESVASVFSWATV